MKTKQIVKRLHSVSARKKAKQLLAVTLAVLMMNPVTGYGVTTPTQGVANITGFMKLPSEIATQQLAVGAEESDIQLPNTLKVTASNAKVVLSSGEISLATKTTDSAISTDLDGADTEQTENKEVASQERILTGITWRINGERSSSHAFDSANAGEVFYYEPVLPEGYALADGVSLPQITVSVGAFRALLAFQGRANGGDVSGGLDLSDVQTTTNYTAGNGTILWEPTLNTDGTTVTGGTLTLKNAEINSDEQYALKLGVNTVIKLEGANSLTNTHSSGLGIFASSAGNDMPVTIQGDSEASLTVNAYQCAQLGKLIISGAKVHMNGSCYGIIATGDVLINDGAQVSAKGGEFGDALQVGMPPMGGGDIMPSSPSLTVQGGSALTIDENAMITGGLSVDSGSTITIPEGNKFMVLAMNSGSITNNGTIVNNGTVLLPFTLSPAEVNALGISGEVILIDPITPGKEYIYVGNTRYLRKELRSRLDIKMGVPEEATYYKLNSGDHDCYILFTPANGSESPVITLHNVNNTDYLTSGIKLPSDSITLHLEGVNLIDSITGDGNIAITGTGILGTKIVRLKDTATLTIADGVVADVLHETGAQSGTHTYTFYGNRSASLEIYPNDRLILAPGAVLTLEAAYQQTISFAKNTTLDDNLQIGVGASIVNNANVVLPLGTTAEQIKALPLSGTGVVIVPTAYDSVTGAPTTYNSYNNDGDAIILTPELDVTTGNHTDKTVESDGYAWDNATNTLTLGEMTVMGNVTVPAEATIKTASPCIILGSLQTSFGTAINLTFSGTAPLHISGNISGGVNGDTVTVQDGAQVSTGRISLGASGGMDGTLNVTGAGTNLKVSETFGSAVYCEAVNVTNGATLTASSDSVGVMAMGGNVTVTGGSTLITNCEYGVYIIDGKLTVDANSKLITNGTVAPFCVVDKTSGKSQNDVLALSGTPDGTEIASVTGTLAKYWSLTPTNGSLSILNENSEPVDLLGAKTGKLTFVKASSGGGNNNTGGGSSGGGNNNNTGGGSSSGGSNNTGGSSSGGGSASYDYYNIQLSKEGNGTISPDGGHDNTLSVRKRTDQTFTFTPDKGYQVSDVLADGKGIGAQSSYTFKDITKDHTLKVIFKKSDGQENPQTGVDFEDVTEKDWFYDSVVSAVGKGWFAGTSDTTFSPYLSTTRGMIATVLWRMEQMPNFASATIFEDVLQGQWYYDGVTWAQKNDIVKGYGNGKFGPNDYITREQLASILYRYAQFKGFDVSQTASLDGFSDGNQVSAYATETMKWAVGANLISGKGSGILDSSGKATRAEVATMLNRFNEIFSKK